MTSHLKNRNIVIIGGGGTGAAAARDLALRGYTPVLIERDEFTGGTTGRHHGQLHSGARYAVGDSAVARECFNETVILRRIAPDLIEDNGGLFIATSDEEADFAETFRRACSEAGIENTQISGDEARRMEPALSSQVRLAVSIPADASFDAWRLPAAFFADAMEHGARLYRYAAALAIETSAGAVTAVRALDRLTGKELRLEADAVINAGGPWVGKIAELAGGEMEVTPSPGTMVAVKGRLIERVISRLRPSEDGDILVPQRTFSIIGSTQWITEDPDRTSPPREDVQKLMSLADEMVPVFSGSPYRAAWSAARPLARRAAETAGARSLSRDFECVHHRDEGAAGLFSLVGGKATILRIMGETAADRVSAYFGDETRGSSADSLLPPYRRFFDLLGAQEKERREQWM
jgi:glycerol-3-phosphate dehydrogenase